MSAESDDHRCPACAQPVSLGRGQRVLSCSVVITTPIVAGKAEPATRAYTHALGVDLVADLFDYDVRPKSAEPGS